MEKKKRQYAFGQVRFIVRNGKIYIQVRK